jgi:hypothetical protein
MEPTRITEARLLSIQSELSALEPIFHHPELGTTRVAYEGMTDEGFWEVGASGRRYSRDFVIETLIDRYSRTYVEDWEASDFYCQQLASELYLLTYTLAQGERITRRSTIWRRDAGVWKIVYHQGTIVAL